MNLNLTLLGEMLTFLILVAFTMKYVWPHLMKALDERQQRIAEGLAAGDRGRHELELAQHKASEIMRDAKLEAARQLERATRRAASMIEEAKQEARQEAERIVATAHSEILIERSAARESLRQEIAGLALQSAQKVLGHVIDTSANNELIEELIGEIASE